jgi:hypothetical protein
MIHQNTEDAMTENSTFESITPAMREAVDALFSQALLGEFQGDLPEDLGPILYCRHTATISIHRGLKTWALIRLGRRSGRVRGFWAKGPPEEVLKAIQLILKVNGRLSPDRRARGPMVKDLKALKAAANRARRNRLTRFRVAVGDFTSPVQWNASGGIAYPREANA